MSHDDAPPDEPGFPRWLHVTLHTRNAWLHGDPRGFRDRNHRLHSSGDYRNRPPVGEHARTHAFYKQRSGRSPRFDRDVRLLVCDAVAEKLRDQRQTPVAVAAVSNHVHLLAKFPSDFGESDKLIAQVKRRVSTRLRGHVDGPTFAQGAGVEEVRDRSHHRATYRYIRDKQGSDAGVWTFRMPLPGATLRSAHVFEG